MNKAAKPSARTEERVITIHAASMTYKLGVVPLWERIDVLFDDAKVAMFHDGRLWHLMRDHNPVTFEPLDWE